MHSNRWGQVCALAGILLVPEYALGTPVHLGDDVQAVVLASSPGDTLVFQAGKHNVVNLWIPHEITLTGAGAALIVGGSPISTMYDIHVTDLSIHSIPNKTCLVSSNGTATLENMHGFGCSFVFEDTAVIRGSNLVTGSGDLIDVSRGTLTAEESNFSGGTITNNQGTVTMRGVTVDVPAIIVGDGAQTTFGSTFGASVVHSSVEARFEVTAKSVLGLYDTMVETSQIALDDSQLYVFDSIVDQRGSGSSAVIALENKSRMWAVHMTLLAETPPIGTGLPERMALIAQGASTVELYNSVLVGDCDLEASTTFFELETVLSNRAGYALVGACPVSTRHLTSDVLDLTTLTPSGPAVDTADDAWCHHVTPTDVRGQPRKVGPRCDRGAVERQVPDEGGGGGD